VAIAESCHLVAFQVCTVAVNDRQVAPPVLMKLVYRAGEDGVHAASGLPAPYRPIDARAVDFGAAVILFDRQRLPLTLHMQQLQDVVEGLVRLQRRCRSTSDPAEMGQDKLIELIKPNFVGIVFQQRSPVIRRGQKIGTLTDLVPSTRSSAVARLPDKLDCHKNPATASVAANTHWHCQAAIKTVRSQGGP
jgi:hypothetical protein